METFGELRNAKARLQTPSSMFPEEGNEKNRVLLVSVITINGQGRVEEEGVRRSRRPRLQICVQEQRPTTNYCIKSIKDFFLDHHLRYLGHVCRDENTAITKKIMFAYARSMGEDCWKLRYEPNSTFAGYLGPGGFQEVHQITDGPTSTAMKLAIWRNYKLVICIA